MGQLVTSNAGLLTHRDCGLIAEIGMEPRRAAALRAQPEALPRADNCARFAALLVIGRGDRFAIDKHSPRHLVGGTGRLRPQRPASGRFALAARAQANIAAVSAGGSTVCILLADADVGALTLCTADSSKGWQLASTAGPL